MKRLVILTLVLFFGLTVISPIQAADYLKDGRIWKNVRFKFFVNTSDAKEMEKAVNDWAKGQSCLIVDQTWSDKWLSVVYTEEKVPLKGKVE